MSPYTLTRCLLLIAFGLLRANGAESLQLTLPAMWFGVPGVTTSLYYDNVVLTEHPERYRFSVRCDIGTSEERRWTINPTDAQVGDHPMQITVSDAEGKVIEKGTTVFRVAPRNAGAGKELKLLIVGDSLTHNTAYPNELARLLSELDNPKWSMLGTHKPASAKPGVAHEGYGGWTWNSFLTKFDPKPAGVTAGPLARKSTSPFIFADNKGKGVFDLPRYFREDCNQQTPDVVTFLLGINDCFGANPNDPAAMDKHIDGVLDKADQLIAAFRKAAPKAVLAVGLTTPPNSRESGFIANYKGKYPRWGWKRIQHRLVQRMMDRLSKRAAENIFLVPTELNLDPVDGYPVDNGVHPNAIGYAQIGTSFYTWLKAWMALP